MQRCLRCRCAVKLNVGPCTAEPSGRLQGSAEGRLPGSGFRHRPHNDGSHSAPNLWVG